MHANLILLVLYQCFSITFGFSTQEKISLLHISPWETMNQIFQSRQYTSFIFYYLFLFLKKTKNHYLQACRIRKSNEEMVFKV